jgi:hypothetical protein
MAIRRFYDQDVIIRRLKSTSGRKKAYSSTATVEGHIQALAKEARQTLGIIEEKAWVAWFPVDADVNEQDVLVDEDGVEYNVREVVKKDYGINQHLEVVLYEQSN